MADNINPQAELGSPEITTDPRLLSLVLFSVEHLQGRRSSPSAFIENPKKLDPSGLGRSAIPILHIYCKLGEGAVGGGGQLVFFAFALAVVYAGLTERRNSGYHFNF